MGKQIKPEPVIRSTVCSLCDEPWESHGDDPTVLDCIRLLKAKRYTPPYVPSYTPITAGYQCASCGQWVFGTHHCIGRYWYTVTSTTDNKFQLTA